MYSTFAHIFTYVSRLQNHTQPNITKHSITRKTLIIFTSHQNRSLYRLKLRALHIYSSALRATEVRIRNRNTIGYEPNRSQIFLDCCDSILMVNSFSSPLFIAGSPILWRHDREILCWGNSFISRTNDYGTARTLIPTSRSFCSGDLAFRVILPMYSVTTDTSDFKMLTCHETLDFADDYLRLSIAQTLIQAVLDKFPLTFHHDQLLNELCFECLEISLGQVILRLFGPFDVHTGFGVDSFFSSSSHSFDLINQLKEAFINNSLSSFVSLCTRETSALRSLQVCSDYFVERLSLRIQVACSNVVHKYFAFSLAQDSLNSCNGRSVASSSVALFLFAFSTHVCFLLFRLVIMSAPNNTGTGAGQVTALTDAKFDVTLTTPIVSNTGWTRSTREALKDEGLVKFRESFTKKILKTFISSNLNVSSYKATEMDDKANFFYAIGQWSTASLQFESWMRTHFVDSVFVLMKTETIEIPDPNNPGQYIDQTQVLQIGSLFKIWNSVTLDDVFKSCETYFKFSQSTVEPLNLNLSWEFIMANIDNDLRAIVNAELSSYLETNPTVAQSGPMAFHIIANRIIRCTTGLAHNVTTGLMGMGLCHFKGENVVDCVATLRSVLMFLGHGTARSQTPPTLMKILVDVFLRCSNPVFVNYVRNLADFHESEICTPELLFAKLQTYYNELLMKPNGWIRSTKNRAAFTAELPELDAVLEANGMTRDDLVSTTGVPGTVFTEVKGKGRGKGKGGNQANQATQANPAAGGGTPRTGGGTPGEKDAQGRWVYDRKGNKIDYNPPRQGQPNHRNRADGTVERFCSDCGRWGNHDNTTHQAFLDRRPQRRANGNGNGNGNGGNNNSNANADGNAGGNSTLGSMHRATFVQPILNLMSGINIAYDSDNSF